MTTNTNGMNDFKIPLVAWTGWSMYQDIEILKSKNIYTNQNEFFIQNSNQDYVIAFSDLNWNTKTTNLAILPKE